MVCIAKKQIMTKFINIIVILVLSATMKQHRRNISELFDSSFYDSKYVTFMSEKRFLTLLPA